MNKFISVALGLLLPWSAQAEPESYPVRSIRLVVGYPPGGIVDTTARLIANSMQKQLLQPVIVDNRPGASGVVAAKWAVHQPADGYTLLYAATSTHSIAPYLGAPVGYDPIKDFTPIAGLLRGGLILVTNTSSPFKTLQDVISSARAKPGEVMYAIPGEGTSQQMAMVQFARINKIKITQISYKGSAPALVDLLGGTVPLMIDNVLPTLPLLKANRLRPLAVTGLERTPLLPAVPTMDENGVSGMDIQAWNGIVTPAGLPKDIAEKLNRIINRALSEPDIKRAIIDGGSKPMEGSSKEFSDFMVAQASQWESIIKATKPGVK